MRVKTLSIQNPQSYLVACGAKNVENRTWKTDYRGWIYIHSSGSHVFDTPEEDDFPDGLFDLPDDSEELARITRCTGVLWDQIFRHYGTNPDSAQAEWDKATREHGYYMQHGCIVGRAQLVDIVQDSPSIFAEPGANHWIFENAELFDRPIVNVVGRLRLYDVEI